MLAAFARSDKMSPLSSADLLHPERLYVLVCRPALPKDTAQALELTRHIWEGQDYVPQVWETWLNDYNGLLAVAEYGGRVVGLGKLTRLSPDEWWLEGLRVHPRYEGRGIASHLHDYLLDYWERQGSGVVRLLTGSFNQRVQHLCERSGFRKVGEFTFYLAMARTGEAHHFRPLSADEVTKALAFASRTPSLTPAAALVDTGWRRLRLSREHLEEALRRERAWWWKPPGSPRQALLLAMDDEDEHGRFLLIQYLTCAAGHLEECLQDARCLAAALDYPRLGWFAPLEAELEPHLLSAGFERQWDDSLYLYEKSHPLAP
jgi:ribosomal protein S18 acetylase RimI-like enzyme